MNDIQKMKNCENCKHWEDNDCQQEHTFDCKYWNHLNKFDYFLNHLVKGDCRHCLSKHTKIHCDFLNCPNKFDYWELKNE